MNFLRLINSKSLSRKIPTIHNQISLRFRQKSTSFSQSHAETSTNSTQNGNITVWNVYGPPFINCFLIGSITYISLHVIWYKLAFIELQEEMENKVNELENKIDSLKKNNLEVK
ncbi:hypothetical protein C1645_833524 [Glomus cerebriforme]|uniref:Uncharacterized protein n=1 Tax=Glomus cerebriforme TaxID=658196 RepID=A0A397SDP1_9GLOM|nr:hypothetical protein C1645_833524 [Glomus cerebriforme]